MPLICKNPRRRKESQKGGLKEEKRCLYIESHNELKEKLMKLHDADEGPRESNSSERTGETMLGTLLMTKWNKDEEDLLKEEKKILYFSNVQP